MYLFTAAACLASWSYSSLYAHFDGYYPNALLMAALLATAMHLLKTAKTA
jgi:hypothetical protein